jgi:RNA polymerase sigma factor (sigma-70 family)
MGAKIATTQWSQVLTARDGSGTEAHQALESLCRTYWQPLYAYIRHQGSDPDESADLTQAFFAELLEENFLDGVNPEKGRFRSFLLAALRHFLSHERDRVKAQKRGGGTTTISIDVEAGESGYALRPPSNEMSPADVFERRWAITVLDRALARLRQEAKDSGDEDQVEQLKQYLTSAEPQSPYREAAAALGISEGAVATAVHRLRKQYGQCLRAELAELVLEPADIDDELRHMLAVVRP